MISTETTKEPTTETRMTVPLVDKTTKNTRNMPAIIFIENIEEYFEKYGYELLMEEINVYYRYDRYNIYKLTYSFSKFKYMEAQIVKHSEAVKIKIPDIEKAIEAVEQFEKRKKASTSEEVSDTESPSTDMKIDFMVSNNLWAKATVPVTNTVCLWLGADIMCEYTLEEAKVLLNKNLENATTTLKNNESDMDFIKDQITVCEVNIARIYNENVKKQKPVKK
jgi:prefoldin subunit 5